MKSRLLIVLGLICLIHPHDLSAQVAVEEAPAAITEVEEPRPGPPPPLPDLSDPNARTAEPLNEPGANSGIPKTLRGSGARAGGPANELNRK